MPEVKQPAAFYSGEAKTVRYLVFRMHAKGMPKDVMNVFLNSLLASAAKEGVAAKLKLGKTKFHGADAGYALYPGKSPYRSLWWFKGRLIAVVDSDGAAAGMAGAKKDATPLFKELAKIGDGGTMDSMMKIVVPLIGELLKHAGKSSDKDFDDDKDKAGDKKTVPGKVLFKDDFSGGLDKWVSPAAKPELLNGKVYFSAGPNDALQCTTAVPLENVVVEFDGYSETNGMVVFLLRGDGKAYVATIGRLKNTESALYAGDTVKEVTVIRGNVYTPKKWHRYKFVRHGDLLEVYCDGRAVISAKSKKRLKGRGYFAVSSWSERVGIDNVKIYRPGAPVPTIGRVPAKKKVTAADVRKARLEMFKAHKRMNELVKAGKRYTPEGQKAVDDYNEARKRYFDLRKKVK